MLYCEFNSYKNFAGGEPFYPDFVLFLKEKKSKKESVYQIFVELKGDGLLDKNGRFEKSKEGWKQKFLLEIEQNHKIDLDIFKIENKDFRLSGLPFYNEEQANPKSREEFEEAFNKRLLS